MQRVDKLSVGADEGAAALVAVHAGEEGAPAVVE
jgi:hypothetical protein